MITTTCSINIDVSEFAAQLCRARSITTEFEAYAAYQSLRIAETVAYHAWLDAGGHEVDGNETLFATMDALTEARVAKFAEWAKLANE